MSPDLRVVPEPPSAAGLPDVELGASHIEGAHLLSEEAELRLMHRGFTREQVRDWTKEYLAADGSGDVDELVAWIDEKEHEAEMVSRGLGVSQTNLLRSMAPQQRHMYLDLVVDQSVAQVEGTQKHTVSVCLRAPGRSCT